MKKVLAIMLALSAGMLCAQQFQPGSRVPDFQVRDLNGNAVAFTALKGPITVVTFIATKCPVSNSYNRRMVDLFLDYTPRNVKFIFVNANRSEPAVEVRNHARTVGFPFPVYKDPSNVAADLLDAQVTPESYVIDASDTIRYHGAIDDSVHEDRVSKHPLRAALDALLNGKPVPSSETKAFGCTIKRIRKPS
jgi:peroxiredoxin